LPVQVLSFFLVTLLGVTTGILTSSTDALPDHSVNHCGDGLAAPSQ
jgi:hypothetical protein